MMCWDSIFGTVLGTIPYIVGASLISAVTAILLTMTTGLRKKYNELDIAGSFAARNDAMYWKGHNGAVNAPEAI